MRRLAILTGMLTLAPPAAPQGLEFAVARFSTRSAHTLYAGYGAGPVVVFVGVLQNPRTAYREALAGLAARPLGFLVGLAGATTSDGDYAQLYLLPGATLGPARVDMTLTFQQRLTDDTRELYIAPATVFVPVTPRVAVGATWTLGATLGGASSQALGPSVAITVPGGTLGVHLLRGLGARRDELWVTASVAP